MLQSLENILEGYINIISLVSSLAAVSAFIISIIALKISNQKSDLVFKYAPFNQCDKNKYYENGNGKIVLNGFFIGKDERPGNEFNFIVENKSKTPAINPIMQFKFNGIGVPSGINEGWESVDFLFDDLYSRMIWKSNSSIHKGIDVSLESFKFEGSKVDEESSIEVTISADNMNTKTFIIKIKREV